jgi:hypothetical protein
MQPSQPTFESEEQRQALEHYTFDVLKKFWTPKGNLESDLCQKAGWNWDTSQIFIASMREKYRDDLFLYHSRFFLIFYFLGAVLGGIILVASLDQGGGISSINSCVQIDISGEFSQFMGSDKFTQCYALAASDLFQNAVRGGYESLIILVAGFGLIIFLLCVIAFVVTWVRMWRVRRDQTSRIKYFS